MTTKMAITPDVVDTKLSMDEQQTLEHCEAVIGKNMLGVVEFGQALATIRDRKLYRADYETWEEYVAKRWEIKARTSYQYITAAQVFENVRSCAQNEILPANEFQLRQLSRLDGDHQIQAWLDAVKTAPDGNVTGRHIAKVVGEMLGEQIRSRASSEQQRVKNSQSFPEHLKELVWQLIEQIRDTRLNNFSKTTRNELRARLQGALKLLDD